ncbi:hypothetical protein D3C72_525080 [compost metagenome]|jgi:Na+/proline symporter
MMADVYGRQTSGRKANLRTMLLIGRVTMVVATAALYFAGSRMNILDLLVLVGVVWGALVFPVIASFYWDKVTNRAFSLSVLAALALFVPVRFGWLPMEGVISYAFDVLAVIGVGVVAGCNAVQWKSREPGRMRTSRGWCWDGRRGGCG